VSIEVHLWRKEKGKRTNIEIVIFVKDLLDYCPNDALSAWRNCKRTNVSVILSAPKLNNSWVNYPQISLFFSPN
jgi:hypothetical protein